MAARRANSGVWYLLSRRTTVMDMIIWIKTVSGVKKLTGPRIYSQVTGETVKMIPVGMFIMRAAAFRASMTLVALCIYTAR